MRKEQQAQQTISQAGGEAMKELQNKQIYFVTFTQKLPPDEARKIIAEIRRRFEGYPIFTPKPIKGKRMILDINGVVVIITFTHPHAKLPKQEPFPKQEQSSQSPEGFTLAELIKIKKS
jgi:hypothetical protein